MLLPVLIQERRPKVVCTHGGATSTAAGPATGASSSRTAAGGGPTGGGAGTMMYCARTGRAATLNASAIANLGGVKARRSLMFMNAPRNWDRREQMGTGPGHHSS